MSQNSNNLNALNDGENFLTVRQISNITGKHITSIYRLLWLYDNKITRMGANGIEIDFTDFQKWLKARI